MINRQTFLRSLIGIPIIGTIILEDNVSNGTIVPVTTDYDWKVTKQRVTIGLSTYTYSLTDVNKGSKTFGRTIDTVYQGSIFEVEKWANDKFNSGKIKLI